MSFVGRRAWKRPRSGRTASMVPRRRHLRPGAPREPSRRRLVDDPIADVRLSMISRALLAPALACCCGSAAPALAVTQPSPLPPPVPPAPPPPGSQGFDRARADHADQLPRSCLSGKGVAIAVEHWSQWHASAAARLTHERSVRQELGEAALTAPIDLDRLARPCSRRGGSSRLPHRAQCQRDEDNASALSRGSPHLRTSGHGDELSLAARDV